MKKSKRILALAGINADILDNHSVDELNEMSIRDYSGERVSANVLAKDIVLDALRSSGYWIEKDYYGVENMTSKEQQAVTKMVKKYVDRFIKQLRLK